MKPIGGIVLSVCLVIAGVIGGPISIWNAIGQGELLAAATMVVLGIPLFLWLAVKMYQQNRRVTAHRRRLRQNRPIRYYLGKLIRGLAIAGVGGAVMIDMIYLGADPVTEAKVGIVLLAMMSMMSIGGSMAAAGAGNVIRS